jgi:hypothetical protein
MAEAANIIDFVQYQEDRFYEETGLPPELFTTDREELSRRCRMLNMRAQVGSVMRDTELPGDRLIEGVIDELVGAALERMTLDEVEVSIRRHVEEMVSWVKKYKP